MFFLQLQYRCHHQHPFLFPPTPSSSSFIFFLLMSLLVSSSLLLPLTSNPNSSISSGKSNFSDVLLQIRKIQKHGEVFRVFRIFTQSWSDVKAVQKLSNVAKENPEMDFWLESTHPGQFAEVMVSPEGVKAFEHFLVAHPRLHVEMTVDDVQKLIVRNEFRAEERQAPKGGRKREEEEDAFLRSRRKDPSPVVDGGHKQFYAFDQVGQLRGVTYPWGQYTGYSEMVRYMRTLEFYYPNLVQLVQLGSTHEGRSIEGVKIGYNGQIFAQSANSEQKPKPARKKRPKRVFWVDGNMHAREWASSHTALFIINQLVWAYEKDPFITNALNHIDFVIVPCTNPDGFEYSRSSMKPQTRLWRKNRSPEQCSRSIWGGLHCCRGVDLNRNFDFHWAETGSSLNACSNLFAGKKAFSEPEARAIANFLQDEEMKGRVDAFITLHTYAQLWIHPFSHEYQNFPNDVAKVKNLALSATARLREVYGINYKVGTGADLLAPASGGSDDWAKQTLGVKFVYLVELRPQQQVSNGFILRQEELLPTAIETFEAIKVIIQGVLVEKALPLVPLPPFGTLGKNVTTAFNSITTNFPSTATHIPEVSAAATFLPNTTTTKQTTKSKTLITTITATTTSTTEITSFTPTKTTSTYSVISIIYFIVINIIYINVINFICINVINFIYINVINFIYINVINFIYIIAINYTYFIVINIIYIIAINFTYFIVINFTYFIVINIAIGINFIVINIFIAISINFIVINIFIAISINFIVINIFIAISINFIVINIFIAISINFIVINIFIAISINFIVINIFIAISINFIVINIFIAISINFKATGTENSANEIGSLVSGGDEEPEPPAEGRAFQFISVEVNGREWGRTEGRKATNEGTNATRTAAAAVGGWPENETSKKGNVAKEADDGSFFVKLPADAERTSTPTEAAPSSESTEQQQLSPSPASSSSVHSTQFHFTLPSVLTRRMTTTTTASPGMGDRSWKQFTENRHQLVGEFTASTAEVTRINATIAATPSSTQTLLKETETESSGTTSVNPTTAQPISSAATEETTILDAGTEHEQRNLQIDEIDASLMPTSSTSFSLIRIISAFKLNSDNFTEFDVHQKGEDGSLRSVFIGNRGGQTGGSLGDYWRALFAEQKREEREGGGEPQQTTTMTSSTGQTVLESITTNLQECRDERSSCAFWIRAHPLVCTEQMRYMRRNCALSCGFCSGRKKH
uniref:ShKT domain-containing protein n=1 Tax=Globodera rostochiensis TaxID=31243 RepID=A0A914H226_GLORO